MMPADRGQRFKSYHGTWSGWTAQPHTAWETRMTMLSEGTAPMDRTDRMDRMDRANRPPAESVNLGLAP